VEELLKKLEETNLETEEGCVAILEALEKEISNLGENFAFVHAENDQEVSEGRATLLSFLDSAMLAFSLVPRSLRRKAALLGRLQGFVNKVLASLEKYAQKLKVETYSITVGVSPSITLTFRA
jgi:hypothetical protein